ncbi:MAG TPA: OsmC family peroxiredoxin [Candidatus Polarisedimenticolia bacterium]|nr:OsmC family peroxiredoxin [Candidatus Polarisedimenticolia bacterium]
MPVRHSSAVWNGVLRSGSGKVTVGKGVFEGAYSFASRFEDGTGTNPEELIGAAHAACLSMALAAGLERAGTPAERVATKASVTLEKVGDAFRITKIRLEVRGRVPNLTAAAFKEAAEKAKDGCPVSNALKGNVALELDAALES